MLSASFIPSLLLFALVIAAGALVRERGDPDTAGRRSFLFLIWTGAGLLAATFIADWLTPFAGYGFATLLAPTLAGVLALILVRLRDLPDLRRKDKALVALAMLLSLGPAAVPLWSGIVARDMSQAEMVFIILAIFTVAVLLAVAWTVGKRRPFALSLVTLIFLALYNGLGGPALPIPVEPPPSWLPALSVALYLVLPGLAVATVAVLLVSGLKLLPVADGPGPLWRLAPAFLVLGAFIYTFAWIWLWDGTDDGLRALALLVVSGIAAYAAALVVGFTTTGWRRWVGLAYPVLLAGLMTGAVPKLWQEESQPTYRITEARAARIEEAVESFQATTGRYPRELAELVPGELWWISPPMILPRETWCYQAGADYYRLGAIYREHWSAPFISVRVYASAGDPPQTGWRCDEKVAELRSRYDMGFAQEPTATPLPTSAAPGQRIPVQPVLAAPSIATGSWSPDGAYLVVGLTTFGEERTAIALHFLEAATGAVCRASEAEWTADIRSDGLRRQFAWLPDGRLLYVSQAGRMVAITPCAEGVEELTSRYPATFTGAPAFDGESGRVLLTTGDAYWLLDGASLEARPIPGIGPSPDDSAWGWYAWSPGGERLALSLPAREGEETGGSLFIVDWATGEVTRRLPLERASEESLPVVEWLARDELLVQSGLMLIDLRLDPPQRTNLLRDVFLLDLAYPTDFSSMDSISSPAEDGYYLAVRANHPRNQGVYLYSSETGEVEVFEHDTHTLLFPPGGEAMRLPKWEDDPSYGDEYEMVWIDKPGETQRLAVEGHTPRDHPQIFPQYLPASEQLVVSSSQGVSLIAVPTGETIRFWELAGGGGRGSRVLAAPSGEALGVVAAEDGLYYLPLPPRE